MFVLESQKVTYGHFESPAFIFLALARFDFASPNHADNQSIQEERCLIKHSADKSCAKS